MIRISEDYQSLFLQERKKNNRKNYRDLQGLDYHIESIPFHSTFMQQYLLKQIDSRSAKLPALDYETVITEKKVHHPINISTEMVKVAQTVARNRRSERDTAYLLFQWIVDTISYDSEKKRLIDHSEGKPIPYRSAVQTFQERKGVCGEMANLNVALARIAKMKANYASVRQLEDGRPAVHACAAVYVSGKAVLSDPALKKFDIRHRQYEIVPDTELEQKMRAWNNGTA